jgi:SAM-dependent methyltransferase
MHSSAAADDGLDVLIQLFLLGESVRPAEAREHLGTLDPLSDMDLVTVDDGRVSAPVALYPLRSLYMASDRLRPDARNATADEVFSAINPNTEEFLAMLPDTPCPSFLELCAGAGAAALIAARFAAQSFAFDLAQRACLFAEFNRRLNGLGNVTVAQGDLYAPARRQTFDRIVAHPPYVPVLRPTQVFRDGGTDGEALTRRIVEGLPNYLEPGGRLYCLALVPQVHGQPFGARVREWLRERQGEFDVVVITRRTVDPAALIFHTWRMENAEPGDISRWQSVLRGRGIEGFAYVSLIVRRHSSARPALTIERQAGREYCAQDAEALLRQEDELAAADWDERVASRRPAASPGVAMRTRRVLEGGGWSSAEYRYEVEAPFRFAWDGPAWVERLLAQCDGTRTCTELHHAAGDVVWDEFARVVRELIGGGLLRLP